MKTLPPLMPEQEREWAKQEQAFDAERQGGTGGASSYRLLARALREPLVSAPPAGFAAALARRAERDALLDAGWERRGIVVLLASLALLTGFGLFMQGQNWLADLQSALPSLPRLFNGWTLLLLAAVGLSHWPLSRRPQSRTIR